MPEYIDVVVDTDPQDIMDDFITFMQTVVPGWTPSPGQLDVWMMMTIAFAAAESRDVASRVPKSIFRWFGANLVNLPPIDAAPASVASTWTVQDNAGYTIPAGTQVSIAKTGNEVYAFATTSDTVIPPGSTTATNVQLLALEPGADASDIGSPGAAVQLLDPLSFVTGITMTSATAGGADAESDDDYLNRLAAELRLLAPRPILPGDFSVFARQIAGVSRATTIDGYNPFHNLLTVNEASMETDATGWAVGANCTLAQSTAQAADGTHSLAMTSVAAGDMWSNEVGYYAVTPGDVMTALASIRANTVVRQCRVMIAWFDSSHTLLSTSNGTLGNDSTTAWTAYTLTATAPSGAAYARVRAYVVGTGGAGEVHYVDKVSLRRGSTTDWVPGGTPETGNPRMITVAVVDANGNPVSSAVKNAVQADLQARRETTFIVNVMDPTSVIIDVTYQVKALTGYDQTALLASINAAIAAYINPATWGVPSDDPVGWNDNTVLRYLEVAQIINNVQGVDYITSTGGNLDLQIGLHSGTLGRVDVTLPGVAPLPTTVGGTISGTVT